LKKFKCKIEVTLYLDTESMLNKKECRPLKTWNLTDKVIDKGLASRFRDFDDSLQYYCAIGADCNMLITLFSPDEYLSSLKIK